jgi:transposase
MATPPENLPLFDAARIPTKETPVVPAGGRPRVREPERRQGEIVFAIPEDALPPTHPARVIWTVLGTVSLERFTEHCRAVEGVAGRPPLSPRMLLTLWLYAISEGIGSAREIARLTRTRLDFRWIVGDLAVSHDKLGQFRVGHGEALSQLMTDILASLMEKGLLSLKLVAQDGTRTRAAASAPSFRTYGSLLQCREQAALHLKAVLAAAEGDDPEYTAAQHAARIAAAHDFQQRVEAAVATVVELQQQRKPSDSPARASTTDAEARVMKMGDGGFRPAYNVQYATAGSELGGPRTIVGVTVTNVGSDMGSLSPMAEQIKQRTGQYPEVVLADANHVKHQDIQAMHDKGIAVVAAPPDNAKTVEQLRAENAEPGVIAWRERMESEEAKKLYRARAGLAELTNAHQKDHHDLSQVLVRGLEKVTSVVLLSALASNILLNARHLL